MFRILNRTKGRHFVKNLPILNWSGFQRVDTIASALAKDLPFESRTFCNPTIKNYGFQMFPDFKWSDFRSPLNLNNGKMVQY